MVAGTQFAVAPFTPAEAVVVPIPLVPVQWFLLFGLPLVCLAAGVAYVQRRDHLARMVELGRSVDVAE